MNYTVPQYSQVSTGEVQWIIHIHNIRTDGIAEVSYVQPITAATLFI